MRKCKLILTVLVSGFFFQAQCQFIYTKQGLSNNYFSAIYEEPGTGNYFFNNINSATVPLSFSSQLLKISRTGALIDSLNFDPDFAFSHMLMFNNYFYFFGAQLKKYSSNNLAFFPSLLKYDSNWNLVDSVVLDSVFNKYADPVKIVLKGNTFYLVYSISGPGAGISRILKLDQNFNKLDSVSFPGEVKDCINYNNHLLISGRAFQSSTTGIVQVAELDTSFNVLNRFDLDSLAHQCGGQIGIDGMANLLELGNNKYYVTGTYRAFDEMPCISHNKSIVSIIKNNNQVCQTHIIGKYGFDVECYVTQISTSGKYNAVYSTAQVTDQMIGPSQPQNNMTEILVHKVDTAGNLLWANYYGGDMYYFPLGICATADSGVVVCGMRYDTVNPKVPGVGEGFVMRLDKDGGQNFVGIRENGKINTNYHKCYPNPANNQIAFDIPLRQNIEISIYNTLGKEILVIKDYQNLSALNISDFVPGAYVYKIKTKNSNNSGKFVKE